MYKAVCECVCVFIHTHTYLFKKWLKLELRWSKVCYLSKGGMEDVEGAVKRERRRRKIRHPHNDFQAILTELFVTLIIDPRRRRSDNNSMATQKVEINDPISRFRARHAPNSATNDQTEKENCRIRRMQPETTISVSGTYLCATHTFIETNSQANKLTKTATYIVKYKHNT